MMTNTRGREAVRGAEAQILDFIAEGLTSRQWKLLLEGPLKRAAGQGNGELAQKLVEAGAQIGDALHEAVRGGHTRVANDLLESGAPINARHTVGGFSPLHLAAHEGNPEMAQLLMLKGADKDALDDEGCTPLFTATRFGRVAAALALLAGGAGVNIRCGWPKEPVVWMAAKLGHVGILRAAIEHGADVGAANSIQRTALHVAAGHNKVEEIDVLVEAGACIEARDTTGSTPLHFASGRFSLDALTALLKNGADVNAQSTSLRTSLHCSAAHAGFHRRAAKVVDALLRSGADETIVDRDGKTAADVVTEDVERVRHLLENAPADRAWRRRGYLVLCRAHPHEVQRVREVSRANAFFGWMTRIAANFSRIDSSCSCGTVGERTTGGRSEGEWSVVAARVLRLQEEGVFRAIVGYL